MSSKEELLAKARKPAEESRRLHAQYKGKIQTMPKCPIRGLDDFALWYTPGVAAPCRDIQETRGRCMTSRTKPTRLRWSRTERGSWGSATSVPKPACR